MPNRKLLLAAFLLLSGPALAQDKTLTFDNANPAKTVHLQNGTSVSIGTTGNLVAKCVLSGTDCLDIPAGGVVGNPVAPVISILDSSYSTVAVAGAYSPGTKFTLTPSVDNTALVCWRRMIAGPATSWTGAITANLNTAVTQIALNTPSTTYTFRLDCFNMGGGATSNEISVTTAAGTPPPPPPGTCPDSSWVPTLNDYGFTRSSNPQTWLQIQGTPNFPSSLNVTTNNLITVPKSSSGLVFIGADRAKYVSVLFTTPASGSGDFSFQDSQVPGTLAANKGGYYLTISRCEGDFRYNIANPSEPSEGQACKNIRKAVTGAVTKLESLRWDLSNTIQDGTPTHPTCGLAPSTTYFLNYANVYPDDGYIQSEHNCPNNTSNCGVQFKSN